MRALLAAFLLFIPAASAQTPDEKQATLKYIDSLREPATGGYKVTPNGKPSLRACNGAVKAIKYLGGTLADKEKVAAFVLSCYDPATGAFAEPGGKPDVAITSIGYMAAAELGVAGKCDKAIEYLGANAKTFDDVRIAAAALEVADSWPVAAKDWVKIADEELTAATAPSESSIRKGGEGRRAGSVAAFYLRLGKPLPKREAVAVILNAGQGIDGGWGKAGEKASDLESTYRVMRAFYLMKEPPKLAAKVRDFVAKCRNADGGYGVTPGAASSMSGVYYASILSAWLGEMEKK